VRQRAPFSLRITPRGRQRSSTRRRPPPAVLPTTSIASFSIVINSKTERLLDAFRSVATRPSTAATRASRRAFVEQSETAQRTSESCCDVCDSDQTLDKARPSPPYVQQGTCPIATATPRPLSGHRALSSRSTTSTLSDAFSLWSRVRQSTTHQRVVLATCATAIRRSTRLDRPPPYVQHARTPSRQHAALAFWSSRRSFLKEGLLRQAPRRGSAPTRNGSRSIRCAPAPSLYEFLHGPRRARDRPPATARHDRPNLDLNNVSLTTTTHVSDIGPV